MKHIKERYRYRRSDRSASNYLRMDPVTELKMATNTTFSSILNEIQLSNLNFTINLTPYAAYITLKKSVQKDINGTILTPAPPLLFLLHKAQEQTLQQQVENSELRSTINNLEKKLDAIARDNAGLVESLEDKNKSVADLNSTKSVLRNRSEKFEAEVARNQAEKKELEVRLKEFKKKHVVELKEQQAQVNDLKNTLKGKAKENHDLSKALESSRSTIRNYKSERSQLKTCQTRLESEIRKLKQKQDKEKKKPFKSEYKDENSNTKSQVAFSDIPTSPDSANPVCSPLYSSMITHWNPLPLEIFPITTMATHAVHSPPPTLSCSLVSTQEFQEMIDKMCERVFANLGWGKYK